MTDAPRAELAAIRGLLDERVEVEGSAELTTYQRVSDLVQAFELWSNLAIRRLHEIHRLTDQECPSCSKYLDGPSADE